MFYNNSWTDSFLCPHSPCNRMKAKSTFIEEEYISIRLFMEYFRNFF